MIQLEQEGPDVILPVRAQAAARSNGLNGEHDGALRVSVTQAPEKGKANNAIIVMLAKKLKLRKAQIALRSGAAAAHKKFTVADITVDELRARLEDAQA